MKHKLTTLTFIFCLSLAATAQNESVTTLDLQQCVDIALENNLTVRRSLLLQQGAEIDLRQSKAAYLPNLNVGGGYGVNWGRSIDPTTNQFINQQINFTGFNGSSNMTLFNWFRITNTVKQSKIELQAAMSDVEKAKNDISLNIVTFYLNVVFNRELLENARYQLKSSQEQLDRTTKMVAGGALPLSSQLELTSQVATNELNVVTAQNSLDMAMLSLKQAMLIPISQKIELVVPQLDVSAAGELNIGVDEVYEAALENMPEIAAAEFRLNSAVTGLKVSEAAYAPTLSLNGNFSTNYSSAFQDFIIDENNPITINRDGNGNVITNPTFYQTAGGEAIREISVSPNGSFQTRSFSDQLNNNLSRSVSLNLSVPIFNNLRANAGVQRSRIALQQAEIAIQEQKNLLRQTIETAYNDAFAASKTYSASARQVEALEETFRSASNQYNLGAANFTDYQVAENNLFRAKSDLVRARYDFIFKMKVLDFYQGKEVSF